MEAAEQKEKERKKQMEESRLKKLQKIIDKEHLQKKKRKKLVPFCYTLSIN